MNRILALILTYLFVLSSLFSQEIVVNGIKYKISDETTATVIGCEETTFEVYIPTSIEYNGVNYNVSLNGDPGAFYMNPWITSFEAPSLTYTPHYNEGGLCYNCSSLKSIKCDNLLSIGGAWYTADYHTAFASCNSLEQIIMPKLQSIGDCAFFGTAIRELNLPSLETVADNAFHGVPLESINLPKLKEAGVWAFASCKYLKEAHLDNLQYMGRNMSGISNEGGTFYACTSLEKVVLPEIKEIILNQGNWRQCVGCFEDCTSLKTIELGPKCKSIAESTFKGCTALKYIYCKSITPPSISLNTFDDSNYTAAVLFVPYGTKDNYKNATGWSSFYNIVETDDFESPSTYFDTKITVGNYGTVSFNGKDIKNEVLNFSLQEGSNINIHITPDEGYQISSLTVNGVEYKNDIKDNNFTYNNINNDISIEVKFEETPIYLKMPHINGGNIGIMVEKSKSQTLRFYPEEGWEVYQVIFNGTDVTSKLSDLEYKTPVINNDSEINVIYKEVASTTINSTFHGDIRITGNTIYVEDALMNTDLKVYKTDGTILLHDKIKSLNYHFDINYPGIYIIEIAGTKFKISL